MAPSALVDLVEIRTRQDGIESLLNDEIRQPLRDALAGVADMERLSAKVGQGTAMPICGPWPVRWGFRTKSNSGTH